MKFEFPELFPATLTHILPGEAFFYAVRPIYYTSLAEFTRKRTLFFAAPDPGSYTPVRKSIPAKAGITIRGSKKQLSGIH